MNQESVRDRKPTTRTVIFADSISPPQRNLTPPGEKVTLKQPAIPESDFLSDKDAFFFAFLLPQILSHRESASQ